MAEGSSEHLLGTDSFGRDVFTRILYGARVSMIVVVFSLAIAVVIGGGIGIAAGYFGGWIDTVLMRAVDVMKALPHLLVAIVVAVVLGPSIRNVILILGLLIWPNIARLIRGEALLLKELDFVAYARAVGVSRWRMLSRHIFPNVLPTLLVAVTLQVANVITTEASLSFLGAGVPPPNPSWGVIIEDGRALVATGWWISLFSGLVVVITVLSFNSLGDWLRDRLDPQTRELV
jgi:peptide/nickel transport system permease protein